MAAIDPVFVAMAAALVAFFFFLYLLIRRTVTSFREGVERAGED